MIVRPDKSKLRQFLIAPLVFGVATFAFLILATGFDIGAILVFLLIYLVIFAPFFLFVIPTFLMETITIEGKQITFQFMLTLIPVRRTLDTMAITRISEESRVRDKKRTDTLSFIADQETITLSIQKYNRETIQELVRACKRRNPHISIEMING